MNTYRFLALICVVFSCASVASEPYPLDYWALREVVNFAQVSPDGEHLAFMKIATKDGNPVIEVYDANELSKKPFRVGADPMEITNFYWVSDSNIIFTARQKVRNKIEGFNEGVYETKLVKVDIETKKVKQFDELNPTISDLLPNKPEKVILSFFPTDDTSKVKERFRPRAYYEFDLKKGSKKLLIQGSISVSQIEFTGDGQIWGGRGFEPSRGEYVWYIRRPGESGWDEIYRLSEDTYEDFFIENIDLEKDSNVLVAAHNGNDKLGFWSFNYDTKTFDELIYRRSDVDVYGTRYHSNEWTHPDTVTGVTYFTDKLHTQFFDDIEDATYQQLEGLIPYAHYLNINSRSRDGKTLTIYNSGPRDPGTYYLIKDSTMQAVGSRQPLLESEKLADMEYITYKSRDGLDIRAYLTVPNGEPPFPLIVLPHGGPFVTEGVIYDEWSQFLANNGYMVIQPQYRGSFNYGLNFHKISFENGGQGGYKMQDDKDDAALHLVEKGLADPDRLAMFGWSYGGYAALVAASRTPQIYQCVIAGAAVADHVQQVNYYRDQLRGAQKETQLKYRHDSISPINEVEKVNIPILLIHGDVDQRVPMTHAKRYKKELDKYNKNYKFVELKGADHFSNTLFYEHQILLYQSMIDYLKHDCGPGGL